MGLSGRRGMVGLGMRCTVRNEGAYSRFNNAELQSAPCLLGYLAHEIAPAALPSASLSDLMGLLGRF